MRRWFSALLRLLGVAAVVAACRSWLHGRGIPFGGTTSGWVVGPDFPEHAGIAGSGTPRGEMDDLDAYRRDGFDPDDVHPEVRAFYEETADYEMAVQVRWHRPFRLGAALAAPVTSAIQQLNLPGPLADGRLSMRSRFVDITADDPRDDVRAWVRTNAAGEAVFVALYGSHESDGERFVNVGVPLPGASLATVLRLAHFDGTAAGTGIEATSRGGGDPGLYAVIPRIGAFALPMSQRFRVWPGDAPNAPAHPRPGDGEGEAFEGGDTDDRDVGVEGVEGVDVVATHEMWLFGRQFLTVTYGARRGRAGVGA